MNFGTVSLPLRSSPTRRSLLRTAGASLAHVHASSAQLQSYHPPSDSTTGTMFHAASKRYESSSAAAAAASRTTLKQQLFPSSSPSASSDIRDQFKKTGSGGPPASSARTEDGQKSEQPRVPGNRSLSSLYSNPDSFREDPPEMVDLTTASSAKLNSKPQTSEIQDSFLFEDDDFTDDENLDLDTPMALPALPKKAERDAKENMPPPPNPTQLVDWSSSPQSHWQPPPNLQREVSAASNKSDGSRKRQSSDEGETAKAPLSKKRVLPWKRESPAEEELPEPMAAKTPAQNSKKDFFDPSASAIKEQKRQLKNQRQQELENGAAPKGEELQPAADDLGPKMQPVSLSQEQMKILDMVVNKGQSVFFTGAAGTGKSVLMRAIISALKSKYSRDPERVAVTASTGLAACNIGGITLHSFSGIGLGKEPATMLVKKVRRNPKAKDRWLKTKCLIIDEISMVDGDLFDKLSHVGRVIRNNGRPWGGIQLIITGDFFQLPPVPDSDKRDVKFAFDASTWSTSIDHTIGLTEVFRQRDPEFARMLNEMRLGKISTETEQAFKNLSRPLRFTDGVEMAQLFPTRAQVENSNASRLRALPGEPRRYEAADSGAEAVRDKLLQNMMAPKSLDLKVGAQVMLIKNFDQTLVNGSLGKVIAFSDERTHMMSVAEQVDPDMESAMGKAKRKLQAFSNDAKPSGPLYPVVQFLSASGVGRTVLCQPEEWKVELPNGEVQAQRSQIPLILAWSLSIHKAQGQTLERVAVDLGRVFEKGQAYVALSRATSQHGLQVLHFNKSKVMAHPKVCEFYRNLYSANDLPAPTGSLTSMSGVGSKLTGTVSTITDFVNNRKGVTKSVAAPAANKPKQKPVEVINLEDEEEAMRAYGR